MFAIVIVIVVCQVVSPRHCEQWHKGPESQNFNCFLFQLLAGMPPWSDFHGWLDGWMRIAQCARTLVHGLTKFFFTIYTRHVHVISRLYNVTFKKS